jgi:hypothetical protein
MLLTPTQCALIALVLFGIPTLYFVAGVLLTIGVGCGNRRYLLVRRARKKGHRGVSTCVRKCPRSVHTAREMPRKKRSDFI